MPWPWRFATSISASTPASRRLPMPRRRAPRAAGAITRSSEGIPMIAVLRGQLLEKHPSRLIVDVHGVGYDVQVPVSTFYQAGEPGDAVTLRIHTHVREDQIALF